MFTISSQGVAQLESDLGRLTKVALPFAVRKTLNDAAFQAQRIARADVSKDLVLRNRFTIQSIRVNQARGLYIPRQEAVVGSIADYMEDQEFGVTKAKQGKEGVPIATSYSAGQGQNSRPRTRLPRRANRLPNITLQRRRKRGSTRKQQNLIAIRQAVDSGRKFVFLDLGRTKGIFRVAGGKRRPKIKMVYDLSRSSVAIPRRPWLRPAFDESALMIPAFYADALRDQARRNGILQVDLR